MIFPVFPRFKLALAFVCVLMLAACSHTPKASFRPPPPLGNGYPERIAVQPPGAQEVVVVINDNVKMLHAGMFAAETLLDPAGSYEGVRSVEPGWPGPSLQDYVRFQLEDGPDVKLYRFVLSAEEFAQVKARVDDAGITVPLFCAAKVQNIISGIGPFVSVPDAWLVSPGDLARHLDLILDQRALAGVCEWPNGASCNPSFMDKGTATARR